jgi:hypothetical protein
VPRSIEYEGLVENETRAGLSIVLSRGIVARGKVVDAAGQPVGGATLSITQQRPGWSEYVHTSVSEPDGSFSCSGLSPQPMRVRAESTASGRVLRADVTLDPATPALVVTLIEHFTLRGRVLDDLGRTLLRYTAGVKRIDPSDPNPKARTIDVQSPDGVFAIDDVVAGKWEVFVYGRGIVFEPARAIEVPHAGELVFTVRRPAVLSGQVQNADGTPAARVLVQVDWDRPAMFGGGSMREETSVTTSAEGRFELTEIYPGRVRVTAARDDGRRTPVMEVTLASGESRSNVVLAFGP